MHKILQYLYEKLEKGKRFENKMTTWLCKALVSSRLLIVYAVTALLSLYVLTQSEQFQPGNT